MPRSTARSSQVASGLGGLRTKCAQIIGVNVSDTAVETAIAKARVTENSRKMRPTSPVMNNSGMKAATSDMLIESTVNPICRAPSMAARNGDMPFSRLRKQFSIITMASSTTNPTATASAMSERLSIEKHAPHIRERTEEKIADEKTPPPHHRPGPGERQWNCHAGGDGGRRATQEHEYYQHHQNDRREERELHVLNAGPDRSGAVGE